MKTQIYRASCLLLLTLALVMPVEAKKPKRRRAHAVKSVIPDYSPWQQLARRCAEMRTANPGIRLRTTGDELEAVAKQIPLVQEGEQTQAPTNVDPCE